MTIDGSFCEVVGVDDVEVVVAVVGSGRGGGDEEAG